MFLFRKPMDMFSFRKPFILTLRAGIPLNIALLLGFLYAKPFVSISSIIKPAVFMFLSNMLLFYILFIVNFYIIQRNRKLWKNLTLSIFISVPLTVVLSSVFSDFLFLLTTDNSSTLKGYIIINIIKDLVVFMIVQISTLLVYLTKKEQDTAIDHEKLIADNIRTRYEVLKSQVDPHFIFNSLNTLDGLIGMNDESAHEYLHNFSSAFRYVISNKEIIYLEKELAFTKSYAQMMKIRYGDNFRIEYHIDEKYNIWLIMPISLQLLVENAVKHNVVSKNSPLLITIETTPNDTIRVKNGVNTKKEPERGEGIGLANLTERYRLLYKKEIEIIQTDIFCVEIPLIKEITNNS
jgi:two-component system, LytTR family, sensor kinase